jgi:hypothetical protein
MTRDDIVQIAWDVGLFMRSHKFQDEPTKLERFAERIAAKEREACAELCQEMEDRENPYERNVAVLDCASAIRARGE